MTKQSPIGRSHIAPSSAPSAVSVCPRVAETAVNLSRIGAAASQWPLDPTEGAGASNALNLITADARKVSSRDFLDAITGRSDEIRAAEREQSIRQCIRRIELGLSLYGYPPSLVAECKQIMADEDSGWLLSERSAIGMGK